MRRSIIEVYSNIGSSNPPWTTEEEKKFIASCCDKNGHWKNQNAKNRFIEEAIKHNIGLVFNIVRKVAFNPMDEDVFQKAVIGLSDALDKYDPSSNYKISTWVTNPIRWAVMKHQGVYSKQRSISDEIESLKYKYKKSLSVVSINEYYDNNNNADNKTDTSSVGNLISIENLTPDYVRIRNIKSISEINHDGDVKETVGYIMNILPKILTKKERTVIVKFSQGKSRQEIASEMNLTSARIYQIFNVACKKIRSSNLVKNII